MVRRFAHILLAWAPERLRFRLQQSDSGQFSLSKTATVPFEQRPAGVFAEAVVAIMGRNSPVVQRLTGSLVIRTCKSAFCPNFARVRKN